MVTNLRKHKQYYFFLLLLEVIGLILVASATGNKSLQMTYVIMTTLLYIIWGTIHHYVHHDVRTKIVLEYILMGSLGISLAFFVL